MVFSRVKNSPLFSEEESNTQPILKYQFPKPLDRSEEPEPLMTSQEVANWLKMSRVWVYKQAEKGALPFHRVGNAIRFDPAEIRKYLEDRKDLKRIYPRPRNSKSNKNDARLMTQQEAAKSRLENNDL